MLNNSNLQNNTNGLIQKDYPWYATGISLFTYCMFVFLAVICYLCNSYKKAKVIYI